MIAVGEEGLLKQCVLRIVVYEQTNGHKGTTGWTGGRRR
jgi:hypothetical protein